MRVLNDLLGKILVKVRVTLTLRIVLNSYLSLEGVLLLSMSARSLSR
jgi:hypothetical protein